MSLKHFKINVPDQVLQDLRERLKMIRWPDEIRDSGWDRGADLTYMRELADYWLNEFDWRKTEKEINAYPGFIAEIDGHRIHFLHIKGKQPGSIPLILSHGWPGSFLEMMKLVPLLTSDTELTFDLVIPSLLGYGFSQKVINAGCNVQLMADLWCKLMQELNYEKFGAHGGDFGSGISMAIAMKYPQHLIGIHVNNIEGYYYPYITNEKKLTSEEIRFEKDAADWYEKEGAYSHQHRTRPLTLSYGLNDSPIGLCSWIIEKFYRWSDCNGNIESVFTRDELLGNVTLYWVTETIHSSIRLYHESRQSPLRFGKNDFVNVPLGVAHFPFEDPFPPRGYIERGFNVQHWTEFPSGGHFPAMEQPGLLANDIRNFFRKILK